MAVEGEAVAHERVAEEVECLAVVADAVGAAEPEGVVEASVDGFGVVAARVEAREVWVTVRDGTDVLGPVQFPGGVLIGVVEPDGDDPSAVVLGELVVVVPAVSSGLVAGAVGADAGEFGVVEVAAFGEFPDPDRTTARVQLNGTRCSVGEG
ncbi:MAG: hypothetical protein ACXVKQ_21045 [Acidimicrobiia bacterium]